MVPPPLEASVLLTTMPWDGADHWEELELDAALEQSGFKVLHTLSEEVSLDPFFYAFASCQGAKTSFKTLALPPR